MTQSVTYGIDDVFAPGHVGELTQVIPTELVDAVLEETGTRERRLRLLPSRVGVYFVLALGLFEHLGARTGRCGATDVGEGPSRRASEDRSGPVPAAVRGDGRPVGPTVHPRRAVPTLADSRLRRLWESERPRPRAQSVLARPHAAPARPFWLPPADADDLVRNRHPRTDCCRLRHRLEG
ncbi:transposase domain-containing protein [Streptomyces sp. NPDC002669]|uniref:transposase domain-containing protein n=1 Tax=Streptomyces sp. NPDC002669 TaxID=3364658 RepID=UPI0036AEBEA7